jgi:hypothetical protein
MINLFLQHFRFLLEPKAPLRMPAYNKGNVIRGGFGSTFRLSAARLPERGQVPAQAERIVCMGTGIRREATGNSKMRVLFRLGACS